MNYVAMTELPPIYIAELMLYADIVNNSGLFCAQSLANYETDWEFVPRFPMLSDDVFMTVGELNQAIVSKVKQNLEYKNNSAVSADAVQMNCNMLFVQACEMLRTNSDDLYVCKFITPCGRYVMPFLFIAPNNDDVDMDAVKAIFAEVDDEAAARDMIAGAIAANMMSYYFEDNFDGDIRNLAPGLAQKIMNAADLVIHKCKVN